MADADGDVTPGEWTVRRRLLNEAWDEFGRRCTEWLCIFVTGAVLRIGGDVGAWLVLGMLALWVGFIVRSAKVVRTREQEFKE